MRTLSPISTWEFITMLKNCRPPTGWPQKLEAVANSGGPDSTCLLFLLKSALTDEATTPFFRNLVSITVNHQFQECSTDMSNHAAKIAASLGTEHVDAKIPWSTPPYGPKPEPGAPLESIARDARYSLLFDSMNHVGSEAIAFGHHADDQVETMLMRLAKSTSLLGLGGMKPVRRFGMGNAQEGKLGWFGLAGMNRWILRPLLGVSKDRILATCEAHNLEYVTDATNFQPELTLRNAIRHAISKKSESAVETPAFAADIERIQSHAKVLGVDVDLSKGSEALRELADECSRTVENIQDQAYHALKQVILPSPASTILLCPKELSKIKDPAVRTSMTISILRYVSPSPWGSYRAESFRSSASLQRIASNLWSDNTQAPKPFSAGSGVLWLPVFAKSGGLEGWLASRLPSYSNAKPSDTGILQFFPPGENESQITQFMYDRRFLITVDWNQFPAKELMEMGCRLFIVPDQDFALRDKSYFSSEKRYHLPKIILRAPSDSDPFIVEYGTTHHRYISTCEDDIPLVGKFYAAPWASWKSIRKLTTDRLF